MYYTLKGAPCQTSAGSPVREVTFYSVVPPFVVTI